MTPKICLRTKTPRFISSEAALDHEPEERTLAIPASIYRQLVALAEEGAHRFRAPRHEFRRGQAAQFRAALCAALDEGAEPALVAPRGRSGARTPIAQLREFFRVPAHRRWLTRIIEFIDPDANIGFEVLAY